MQIIYHQINITNFDIEIEYLQNLQKEEFFIIGIEITNSQLALHCNLNIDPQHDPLISVNMTCLEYIYNSREQLIETTFIFTKIAFVVLKPDMDSIASIAMYELMLFGKFILNNDIVLRLKAIAKSDRHGRLNYKHRNEDYFKFLDYNTYGIPVGLAAMTSDYKLELTDKIDNMKAYLLFGIFESLEKYNELTVRQLKKSIKNTNVDIILSNKLVFIKSNFRGAVAFGYKYAPVVIARNMTYNFGLNAEKIIGKKITIAQYEEKFIDLISLKNELNELEEGWGGSSVIIGSPQTHPCELEDDKIIQLTLKYLF